MEFDPTLGCQAGLKYHHNVLQPNTMEIERENPNLYEFLIENKVDKINFNCSEFHKLKIEMLQSKKTKSDLVKKYILQLKNLKSDKMYK